MRIAHATDVHFFAPPTVGDMVFKRVLGTANLYLRGRRHDFCEQVQAALVAHLLELRPDLVLITGDLTAQALPAEFDKAREALSPVLDELPTFIVPGNHDVYTGAAARDRFMERWFGPWMARGDDALGRLDVGNVTVLGLDPNRPTWITAAGLLPQVQLDALARALADEALAERQVVLAIHYPPVDRRGALYDRPNHGLLNVRALVEVLEAAPKRPALIASGHVHHGFRADLALADGTRIPVCDCGSSGHSWQPGRGRGAAMAVYDLADDGAILFRRYLHDGEAFHPEPGGPWQSGQ